MAKTSLEKQNKKLTKRKFETSAIQAMKLRLLGLSYAEIAHTLGVSPSAVSAWCKDSTLVSDPEISLELKRYSESYANRLKVANEVLLDRELDEDKLEKATSFQLNIMRKNNLESIRLLENKSTQNISLIQQGLMDMQTNKERVEQDLLELRSELDQLEAGLEPEYLEAVGGDSLE